MKTESYFTEIIQAGIATARACELGFVLPHTSKPGQISLMNSNHEAASETDVVNPLKTSMVPLVHTRILVVEDDPDLRQLDIEVLTESGYTVDAVENGAVAWQAINAGPYDLLVTDNDMAKMSGGELIEKPHVVRKPLPVIMVSGTIPTMELQRHPWLKPHSLLRKPYTIAELLANVKEALCATASAREAIAFSSNWQRRSSVVRLRG